MRQKTNLCVLFLDLLHFTLCKIYFLSSRHSVLTLLRTLNMTFSLFVAYKYFYGFHYAIFVLSMEISRPTRMTLVLRTFRLIFMLRCTSPAVHYTCGILCFPVPIFVGGKHHESGKRGP